MLTDPFLQLPTENSVRVVWFTEFLGSEHRVLYGKNLEYSATATTTKLSRVREDYKSKITNYTLSETPLYRDIWKQEAIVTGLTPNQRVPYQVVSSNGTVEIRSKIFTLAAKPTKEIGLKILLTSDHQLMPMVAANIQKVAETIGMIDAVFFAGDLVNTPDRASEWFDDNRGCAFFPCLQGRAKYELEINEIKTTYRGGEIIQHAPLFTAMGNHEVMGIFSDEKSLNEQMINSLPRKIGANFYDKKNDILNPLDDTLVKKNWIKDNSFNTDTYEDIFTLPQSISGGKKYYAVTFGSVRLIVLFLANMWRPPVISPEVKGKYQEKIADLDSPEKWGYGQHIFEPITQGSDQYIWLEQELKSEEFCQAKYKIVMCHHPVHTLGGNIVPPYTEPQIRMETNADGTIQGVHYDYPPENDQIIRDLMPLLENAGVNLVFYGHSHLWNRFVSSKGINFLESSNVGNSYGAHLENNPRSVPKDSPFHYAEIGDPNGLEPIVPNIAPLMDENGQTLPYIASNEITVFTILDTGDGSVTSYRFDTNEPNSEVIIFDRLVIGNSDSYN